jgi:hypothetical protein
MNAYSQDLRNKVIEIFKQGNHTRIEYGGRQKLNHQPRHNLM